MSRIAKNSDTPSSAVADHGTSAPALRRLVHTTTAAYSESTHPQKRIEPSSALHKEMIV